MTVSFPSEGLWDSYRRGVTAITRVLYLLHWFFLQIQSLRSFVQHVGLDFLSIDLTRVCVCVFSMWCRTSCWISIIVRFSYISGECVPSWRNYSCCFWAWACARTVISAVRTFSFSHTYIKSSIFCLQTQLFYKCIQIIFFKCLSLIRLMVFSSFRWWWVLLFNSQNIL